MKHDIELYAHVVRTEDGEWDLHIGREVTGQASHGAATWVGTFTTSSDAVRYAVGRGVYSHRIAVDVPLFRLTPTVDGGTVLKRVS